MKSKRYILVLDLFGDQESVNMGRWCHKRTGVLYLPALRLLQLYVYHENVWTWQGHPLWSGPYKAWFYMICGLDANSLFFLYSQRIHPFLSLCLSYLYRILLFVLHFPDFSFRVQSFHWSKIESIVMGHGLLQDLLQSQFLWSNSSTNTLLTRNAKSISPGNKIYIHMAHGRLFHLHPTPPRILHSRGVLDDPTPPINFQNCKQGLLTTLRILKWFLKVNTNSITEIQ